MMVSLFLFFSLPCINAYINDIFVFQEKLAFVLCQSFAQVMHPSRALCVPSTTRATCRFPPNFRYILETKLGIIIQSLTQNGTI